MLIGTVGSTGFPSSIGTCAGGVEFAPTGRGLAAFDGAPGDRVSCVDILGLDFPVVLDFMAAETVKVEFDFGAVVAGFSDFNNTAGDGIADGIEDVAIGSIAGVVDSALPIVLEPFSRV